MQADAAFLRDAASANMMEIRLGQTAQTKAMNSAVKQFGQRMVNDHTNLQNQVASLVTANKVSVSQAMNSKNQDEFNRVNKLSGQAFDSAYMNLPSLLAMIHAGTPGASLLALGSVWPERFLPVARVFTKPK